MNGRVSCKDSLLACFFAAATFATIGLPGFGNFWGEFAIFLSLRIRRESFDFRNGCFGDHYFRNLWTTGNGSYLLR